MLTSDATLRIQDDDPDGAKPIASPAVNVARSLGDEPVMVVQSVRSRNAVRAMQLMERTLAQGVVAEPRLAQTQALLADECKHPMMLIAMHGIRGVVDHEFRLLATGQASVAEAKAMLPGKGPPGIRDEVEGYFSRGGIKPAHAWLLRYMNQAVEIAKRPEQEVEPALVELQTTLADAPELARLLAPKLVSIGHYPKKWRTRLRCGLAALAVERYRSVAQRLARIARRPGGRKAAERGACRSVRRQIATLSRLPNGVVVFSIGPDGRGNGEALAGNAPDAEDERLEFRLWHAERRGRP